MADLVSTKLPRASKIRRNAALGRAAEDIVVQKYLKFGFKVVARNFRWPGIGEIDVIAEHAGRLYFVECKSSDTLEAAENLIGVEQVQRIHQMAEKYLQETDRPIFTDMRFDLAAVDQFGQVKVYPGALNFC